MRIKVAAGVAGLVLAVVACGRGDDGGDGALSDSSAADRAAVVAPLRVLDPCVLLDAGLGGLGIGGVSGTGSGPDVGQGTVLDRYAPRACRTADGEPRVRLSIGLQHGRPHDAEPGWERFAAGPALGWRYSTSADSCSVRLDAGAAMSLHLDVEGPGACPAVTAAATAVATLLGTDPQRATVTAAPPDACSVLAAAGGGLLDGMTVAADQATYGLDFCSAVRAADGGTATAFALSVYFDDPTTIAGEGEEAVVDGQAVRLAAEADRCSLSWAAGSSGLEDPARRTMIVRTIGPTCDDLRTIMPAVIAAFRTTVGRPEPAPPTLLLPVG